MPTFNPDHTFTVTSLKDDATLESRIEQTDGPDGTVSRVVDLDSSDGDGLTLREALWLAELHEIANDETSQIRLSHNLSGVIELSQGHLWLPKDVIIEAYSIGLADGDDNPVGQVEIVADPTANAPIFVTTDPEAYTEIRNLKLTGGNLTDNEGGAAVQTAGELVIKGSIISGNNASGDGAHGGAVYAGGDLTIQNSTLTGNSTNGNASHGGAVFGAGDVTLTNVILADNGTGGQSSNGSAVYAGGQLTIEASTLTGNTASDGTTVGGVAAGDGGVTVTNSIVIGNSLDNLISGSGAIIYQGNNIIGGSFYTGSTITNTGLNIEDIFTTTKIVDGLTSGQVDENEYIHDIPLLADPVNPALDAADEGFGPGTDINDTKRIDATDIANNGESITDLGATESGGLPIPYVANDDFVTTTGGERIRINIFANDTNGGSSYLPTEGLSIQRFISLPTKGSISLNQNQSVNYYPADGKSGTDTFQYRLIILDFESDLHTERSNIATVTIEIIELFAVDDRFSGTEGNFELWNFSELLANDYNVFDDESFTIIGTENAVNGQVRQFEDMIWFEPDENFVGEASFDYIIEDEDGDQSTATVYIDYANVDDAPVAAEGTDTTPEDTAVVIDVAPLITELDGDMVTVTAGVLAEQGTVDVAGTLVTFTPAADFNGEATITYKVTDDTGVGLFDEGTVTVTVDPANDAPVAADSTATTMEDTAVVIDVAPLITEVDGDAMTISVTVPPEQGTVSVVGAAITFTPAAGFLGDATITYTVSDATLGFLSDKGTLTVSVVVDEVPRFDTDTQSATYSENQNAADVLATVTATDNVGVTDYEIVSGDPGGAFPWFSVNDQGEITLTDAGLSSAANDYETGENSFTLSISASDEAGNASTPVEVTFSVLDAGVTMPIAADALGEDNIVFGSIHEDHMDAGAGNDVLFGGLGTDVFIFNTGYGYDIITDFASGEDVVDLSRAGVMAASNLTIEAAADGRSALISYSDAGDQILLLGVEATSLTEAEFIFA